MMETKDLVVGEYVVRGSEAGDKRLTAKKTGIRPLGIFAAAVLVVAGIVMAVVLNGKKPVQVNADSGQEQNIIAEEPVYVKKSEVAEHPVSDMYHQITAGDFERVNKKVRDLLAAEKAESVQNPSEELIGLFGDVNDIFASYHANDPSLPNYLKLSINKDFRVSLSQDELYALMKLVEAEAPAEDIYGKILVANVVLNRWLAGFDPTVYEVIYAQNQFTPSINPYYWDTVQITDSSREAVTRALSGEDYSQGAIYFFAWEIHPDLMEGKGWRSSTEYLFIHGGHAFFR